MAVPKKKQSKTAATSGRPTGRRSPPRTRSARSATSRSSRTACAATAATTPAARPSRSSSRVSAVASTRPRSELEDALGVRFTDADLRGTALTHRSYAFERGWTVTNERLEFLGDSVLGLVVTDMAYRAFPDMPEVSSRSSERRS